MDQEYIINIIKGEGSHEEREAFFARVLEDHSLAKEYARLKNQYVFSSLPYKPNISMWFNERKKKNKVVSALIGIAATLFIPLLGYVVYSVIEKQNTPEAISNTMLTYHAGTGVRYTVNTGIKAELILPDSTHVWLNSGSYLDVPHDFSHRKREILLSGEGYFHVKSDPESPFWVNTVKEITVKVTGTEFNLTCYDNDDDMKLTLFKGKLELIRNKGEIINVKPDEQIVISYKTLTEKVKTLADATLVSAWKKGNLRFENTRMDEVLRRLERWYGVHIAVKDSNIFTHSFTADFDSESLSQVLDLMKIAVGVSYKIDNNKVELYTTLQ